VKLALEIDGMRFQVDLTHPHCVAIPLAFGGVQPRFFGAPSATSRPLEGDGFIGDTRQGGSCNVSSLALVPHCNGTHTESVGHILNDEVSVHAALPSGLMMATLVTVTPDGDETRDRSGPDRQPVDRPISGEQLEIALTETAQVPLEALLIRTLPNHEEKCGWDYAGPPPPPYLSLEAIAFLNDRGVQHLLVDFPSVDPMNDQGRLTAHHRFWGVLQGEQRLSQETQTLKTITELIFVPNHLKDGHYLLDLQIPAFLSDAAPSRPLLYALVSP